jgi:hypothetical protein
MPLTAAPDPDTSGLLPRLGLTDEHPMGWLRMTPELREAEWRGLCMILGRPRPDGRHFVVAKTEAGVQRWSEFARESAERMRQFPVLDASDRELLDAVLDARPVIEPRRARSFEAPEGGMGEHYTRQGYTIIGAGESSEK